MNRRSFLASAFAASIMPLSAQASPDLRRLRDYDTGATFVPDKPSLVALFMTAQQMYSSCGELFLYGDAEVSEIRGGERNIEKIMIMPPLQSQPHPSETRNIGSAKSSGFKVLTADLQTTLDISRTIAGRDVFAVERGKITGHSQKAFFYNISDARRFEFDPVANPFANDLLAGIRRM